MTHLIVTFFYVGHLRPAPGTWGSFVALLLGVVIIYFTGFYGLCFSIIVGFTLGWLSTAIETRGKHKHDPCEIVIDEVVGQWISILPLAMWPQELSIEVWYLLFSFGLFRMFDITKPGLIGWADRQIGPLGVMLDDVIAGIMTFAVIALVMVILA